MTTPRTRPDAASPAYENSGYGSLDKRPRRRGSNTGWLLFLVLALITATAGLWFVFGRSNDEAASPASSQPTTTTAETTGGASTTPTSSVAPSASPPAGWSIGGDLIDYVDTPQYATPGTPEADVEIAFVNSEIATSRALANPTVEEEALSFWQTGLTLSGTRDTMRLLATEGQVIVAGPLSRLEVEQITMLNDSEADLEYCALDHGFNVVKDGSAPDQESIETFHAVDRFVRATDGHWQSSENVRIIQDVEGFGDCLDITLQPAQGQ